MYNQTLSITINSSIQKRLLIEIPHILATITLLWFTQMTVIFIWIVILLLCCVCLSCVYYYRLHISQQLKASVKNISVDVNNNWAITLDTAQTKNALLSPLSFSSNYLIILNFITDDKKFYAVLIPPDSISTEEYRKLKVILKVNKFSD